LNIKDIPAPLPDAPRIAQRLQQIPSVAPYRGTIGHHWGEMT
jgi:hypothetical protein